MNKQFLNKQMGYWGASNTKNSTSGYAADCPQQSWPQATAKTTQGYGSVSSDGAELTTEQRATMNMYYAAQKKTAETYAMYYGATTTNTDDRQKQKATEGYSRSVPYGALYGTSATANLYDRSSNQNTTGGYNTITSYRSTQGVPQQKSSERYTANQQKSNMLYGGTKMNMTDNLDTSYGATKGYGNLDMSYVARSSSNFPESSITGTLSMSYGSSMPASGSSKAFGSTTQSSGKNKMSFEGAKGLGRVNMPYGTTKFGSEVKVGFYGTNRQNPFEELVMDDSEDENEPMAKRQAKMDSRRWSREQDEFSGSPGRPVDKVTYMSNKGSVRSNRSWDESYPKNEEGRLPWKKSDSSHNWGQWKNQDYNPPETGPPWKTRDTSFDRGSSQDVLGKEVPGTPRRNRDASFDRGSWNQKDDFRDSFESEESRSSWNKRGASYDREESGPSSKNRDLHDRNEYDRTWKRTDDSLDRGAWNEPIDLHKKEERGIPWKRQAMEEERTPPLNRQAVEEATISPWRTQFMEKETLRPWKKRAIGEGRMQSLRRQGMEDDKMPLRKERSLEEETMLPWKKQVMEEKRLPPWKKRAIEEGRMSSLEIRGMEEDEMSPWKKPGVEDETVSPWKKQVLEEERLPPWKKRAVEEGRLPSLKRQGMEYGKLPLWKERGMEEETMPPWKEQVMENERLPPWKKRALEEGRIASLKRQGVEDDKIPLWKKQGMDEGRMPPSKKRGMEEEMVLLRKRQESVSSGMGDTEGRVPPWKMQIMGQMEARATSWNRQCEKEIEKKEPPWKKNMRALPKKQKGKALKKRLRDRMQNGTKQKKSDKGKGRKMAEYDSDEDPTPVIPDGIAMMICNKRYPAVSLKEKQSKIVMECLLKAMENLADDESPQFSAHQFMSGMLSIICANEHTCEWLKKTIEALEDPWMGANLTARPFRAPMVIHIPGAEGPEDEVKEALQKANPHLKVYEWELMRKEILKFRVEYTYLIDNNSFEVLKVIQFRPYYKNTRVLVKMMHAAVIQKTAELSEKPEGNEKKQGAEPTEADILLKETTRTNEKGKVKSNSDGEELTEADILLRQIEQDK